MIAPEDIRSIVDQIVSSQRRIAWWYACGSGLVSVALTWLLVKTEIEKNRCSCEHVHAQIEATGGNVTINPTKAEESALDKLTREVLIKRGEINAQLR